MNLPDLRVPCLNTTLMGVVRGVADYYGVTCSDTMLFGGSGHAFMINIHKELCPSGPYCWNRGIFFGLLKNLGIEMVDRGFFSHESGADERSRIEGVLRDTLQSGNPCALVNLEYQAITGLDDTGFVVTQPWGPECPVTPAHLTFATWKEFGGRIHVNFFTFGKVTQAPVERIVAASLRYAHDVWVNPSTHTAPPYATGQEAYTHWIKAVEGGLGSSHGNWWNASVWAECRRMASSYFEEVGRALPRLSSQTAPLANMYRAIAEGLVKVADKELAADRKILTLQEVAATEKECIASIAKLLPAVERG